jgi:hypothetical protein
VLFVLKESIEEVMHPFCRVFKRMIPSLASLLCAKCETNYRDVDLRNTADEAPSRL